MDLTVYPKTRIARLPKPLQKPAALAREVRGALRRSAPAKTYDADGLATVHFSPFTEDPEFEALYWRVERDWFPDWHADLRWRVWLLTRLARQVQGLPGGFAEFGVFRGGTAYLTLATTDPASDRPMFLFDTFSGTPTGELTDAERAEGIGMKNLGYSETSAEYVAELLAEWSDRIRIHEGDVTATLAEAETGPLAFVHLDLNAAAPTVRALEYAYERLLPGAVIVFDDYGHLKYRDQRLAIDRFFEMRAEEPIALPTGQAFVVRAGGSAPATARSS